MIILTAILTALIALFLSIIWYQTKSRTARLLNAFPIYGKYFPVLGNILEISTKPDIMFKQIREITTSFTETYSSWGGIFPSLHIITADDTEIILNNTKHIEKGIIYEMFHRWLGTGLLTSTGAKWHQRRKMLTPAFHYNILQMFVEIFGDQCEKFKETLQKECMKPKTDIQTIIKELTLDSICESSMGMQLDKSDKSLSYYNAITELSEITLERTFAPWLHPDITYYMSPLYWREKSLLKRLHGITRKIIQFRSKNFKESDVADLESSDVKPKKRLAMLDLLIYAKRHLGTIDDDGIAEEVDTFVFEGHDTTAVGINFALLLLAHHPEHQKKVIDELDILFGDSDRHATYEDLQNMKYLELCLKESLRLYPSVPMIIRKIKEDVQLTHHVAPAGTEVFVHIYNVHRDPKYFPDPEKFDPDRFLPENSVGRHPFAYIPFSAGPRNCIGQKFAMLELKSVVSTVLRNFTMEPIDSPQDLQWIVDFLLRVNGPIHIKFNSRNKNV